MPRVNQNNVPSISSPSFSGITPNRGIVGTVEGLSIAIKNKVLVLGKRDSSKLIGSFKTMTVMFEAYSKTIHDLISQFSCSREIKIDDDFNQAIDDGKKILSAVGDINESFSSHKSHQTNLLKVIVSPVFKFIVLKGEIFLLNQKLNQIYQQNDKRFDELNDDIRKVTDAYVFNQENDCVLGKSSQSITKHDLNKLYVKNNEFLECCSAYSDFYLELDAHCSNLKAVVSEIVTDNELYQSIYRQLEDSGYRQDEPYVDGTKPNDFANRLSKVVLLSANMTHAVISTFGIIHSGVSELLSCVNQKEILSLCRDVETLVLYIKEQNGVFNKEIAEQFIVPMLKTLSQKLDHDSLFFMQAYVVQDLNKLSTEEQKIISSFFNCFSRFSGFVEHLVKYVQESTISKKESSQGFKSSFVYADLPKEYMHDDFTEIIGMKEAKALMISNLLKDIDSFKFLFFKDLSPVASISELENTTQTLSTQETELQQFSAEPQLESIQKSHEPIIVSPVIKKLKERIRLMLKIKEQAESLQKKINHTKAMLFR